MPEANVFLDFDFEPIEVKFDKLIEDGLYPAIVTKAYVALSKRSKKPTAYIGVRLTGDGRFSGRFLTANFSLDRPVPGQETTIQLRNLGRFFFRVAGLESAKIPQDLAQVEGKSCRVQVVIQEGENGQRNQITTFLGPEKPPVPQVQTDDKDSAKF